MKFHPEAVELNLVLERENPVLLSMLSEKGRAIFFPRAGVISQSNEAKGKKINATLGIAVDEDGSPMRLPSIAKLVPLNPQDAFPYTSNYGKPELRKAWQQLIRLKNPSLKTAVISLPVVTNALTHGLSVAGYLFADQNDSILLPHLYWENYELIFQNAYGAKLVPFNTFRNGGLDLEAFEQALSRKSGKRIVLFSSPNNPTGYTPTETEAETITSVLKKHAEMGEQIVVLLDDAYFGLVYEKGIYAESLFSKLADLHENVLAVKLDGGTKEDYIWGFRVGFVTYGIRGLTEAAAKVMEDKTAGVVRGSISNVSHLSQSILLKAIASPSYADEKLDKFALLRSRYEAVRKTLRENEKRYSEYFAPLPFNSGYFMCVEFKHGINAEGIRRKLLAAYGTGVIVFGNVLRVAFSSVVLKDIPELFENIYRACRE
ncbi:MAG TPA: aminotransferase class I/II-fold pyridoxal phosphate-dependent enzyme [bacterium]